MSIPEAHQDLLAELKELRAANSTLMSDRDVYRNYALKGDEAIKTLEICVKRLTTDIHRLTQENMDLKSRINLYLSVIQSLEDDKKELEVELYTISYEKEIG